MADIYDRTNSSDSKKEILSDFIQRFSGDKKLSKSVDKAKSMIE
jgi:hypothetical protein